MAEVNTAALEQALGEAFGGEAPKAAPKQSARPASPPDEPDEAEATDGLLAPQTEEVADEEAEPVEASPAEEPAPEAEPEFEIEIDGHKEVVKGKEIIKELLQKGKHFSRGTEEVARERELLQAQRFQQEITTKFQSFVVNEIQQLRAMDAQLEQYSRIDWNAAIDADFTNAMKLQEQRNTLRQQRDAKFYELQAKQQQFQQGQAQAAQQLLAAEHSALLAKLPAWRNSDTAAKEQKEIASALSQYGFSQAEIGGLIDHRMLLVAKDAAAYRALRNGAQEKVKQARAAPPVVKPGAAVPAAAKAKASTQEVLKDIRKAGRQGNHKAQEQLAQKLFDRAFK